MLKYTQTPILCLLGKFESLQIVNQNQFDNEAPQIGGDDNLDDSIHLAGNTNCESDFNITDAI